MHIFLRQLRPFTLSALILLLAGCGGGSDGGSTAGPSTQQQTQAGNAAVRGTLDLATNRVTLQWFTNVTGASRYQIEQQDASGAWVVIDGVWAPPRNGAELNGAPQYPQWTGVVSGTTTLRIEAVLPGSTVPLAVGSVGTAAPTSITVPSPVQLPSIELDQLEPLESPVKISLANAGTYTYVGFSVDTQSFGAGSGAAPSYTTSLDLRAYTTGSHVIYATFGLNAATFAVISRSVQIHNSKVAVESIGTLQSADTFTADVVATSDSGIASVMGIAGGVPLDTLTAPNICVPQPCAAGQPFNAYRLSIDTRGVPPAEGLVLIEQAADNAGNTAWTPLNFTVPAPASATLDSPVDGAVVSEPLHVSGTFESPTPGPLELMVTLGGVPVYDTTVVNTGERIPYAADITLKDVTPGYHMLSTYTRVGNTFYVQTASALIQVRAP
jgi:hypothetical protein